MKRTRSGSWAVLAVVAAVFFAGCGGGVDLDGFEPSADPDDVADDDASGGGGDSGSAQGVPGALTAGPVTVSAEPGHAVVTVDGRSIDHNGAALGGSFRCVFSDDVISLDVNSGFGAMTLSADRTDGGWIGRFTADSDEGDDDSWIQYAAQPFEGELGIDLDANTLSYVGAAQRQDRIAMSEGDLDTETVEVTVAVNCGLDPATVEVGSEAFSFPLFAADSATCVVTASDSIDVTVNYLATENRQLQFDVRPDGDGVIGGVFVIDGDDRWSSVISTQSGSADGLSVDGSTATYTGTFEHTSDTDPDLMEEIEGTAVVTCPS